MTSTDFLDQTPQQINKTSLPGRIVLVMQGGGAPGCYQGGAYQALHEAGIEPDWVIGTSIGAINGAIIAGNEVNSRLERLRVFWEKLDTRLPEPLNQLAPLIAGVPGFYYINPALAWGTDARVGIEQAAMYLVDPLKKLLPNLVDFDLVNSGKTRFTLGLTNVQTGQMRYFDSKQERIGPEHVIGSSAIPPCFPAVRIDREYYWDGGVFQIRQLRWCLTNTRGKAPSYSLCRSGIRGAPGQNPFRMLSCAKRTFCSEVALERTSCGKHSFIGCVASFVN